MLLRVSGGGTLLCPVVARMFAFPRWTGVSILLRGAPPAMLAVEQLEELFVVLGLCKAVDH